MSVTEQFGVKWYYHIRLSECSTVYNRLDIALSHMTPYYSVYIDPNHNHTSIILPVWVRCLRSAYLAGIMRAKRYPEAE